jgi:hypothetical protein
VRNHDDEFDLDESDDVDDSQRAEVDDSDETMPCPHCFGTIYDDSELCPHCGQYLSRESMPFRPPLWVVLGVSIALLCVVRWVVLMRR